MDDTFALPTVERIRPHAVKYHPMAPVWQNEGTNEGTIAIIDNYEEIQCQMDPDGEGWGTKLVLWHGDVKTIRRLLSVQALRKTTS